MNSPKIIVHCLVKNEERFVWYALKSVLPFVDKIMVWDTGSTDNTVEIIKSINSKKISFKQIVNHHSKHDRHSGLSRIDSGCVRKLAYQNDKQKTISAEDHTRLRQQMLDQTPKGFTWLMILDGDEIWPKTSIKKATIFARKNPDFDSIVVRTHNLVGDIYHRLPESAGHYKIAGQQGHLALRFMNLKTISGLHVSLPHGQQGFKDDQGNLVQDRDPKKIKFLNLYYHHATHLQRSSSRIEDDKVIKRAQKLKTQLGKKIPSNQVPETFFLPRPKIVPSVTLKAPFLFWLKAVTITPAKIIKQCLFSSPSGY